MKIRYLLPFLLLLIASTTSYADVIHFDDITTSDTPAQVPSNYNGFFSWGNDFWVASDTFYATAYGNSYGSPSGDYAAYNADGLVNLAITSSIDFNFIGAYFTGWAYYDGNLPPGNQDQTSSSITVEGWDDGSKIGMATMNLPTDSYAWLSANFLSIDELRFINDGNAHHFYLMDNLTYNPIPEPTSLLLLGTGLGVLGMAAYRRRRK